MLNPKIADHHLATAAQVRFNQESTERQYNLVNQATSLGWIPEQIRILDGDLVQSGELTTKRDDFKTLVSDVAMGHVGAIFSLETSRLARSNKDWHGLLELCAITKTLVFDGDGCYDPSDFNDSARSVRSRANYRKITGPSLFLIIILVVLRGINSSAIADAWQRTGPTMKFSPAQPPASMSRTKGVSSWPRSADTLAPSTSRKDACG